jgi:excinuclease UvrABC helicase subunit UvrB
VLAATTAFGKTVVAAALIAQRGRNALVLVHRRELLTLRGDDYDDRMTTIRMAGLVVRLG